ncbi:hypothetical protein [Plantactinospora sp. CA-290183]
MAKRLPGGSDVPPWIGNALLALGALARGWFLPPPAPPAAP